MSALAAPIEGTCDPRFAAVRAAFTANFAEPGEVGAAVSIVVDGRLVVDLWGGWMDGARARPWRQGTVVNVFSIGKAFAALALLRLVERGRIALDAPVELYWPEFVRHGKGDITVRMLLAHQAGLPGIRHPLPAGAMYDWSMMTAALADEAPWWEPGRQHGYHVNTFGFLIGEVVRRVTGTHLRDLFHAEVAGPLGAEVHFGAGPTPDERIADALLPDDDAHLPDVLLQRAPVEGAAAAAERRLMLDHVYRNPPGLSGFGTVNTAAWRRAEIPSANTHASARGVAQVYAALLAGVAGAEPLLADESLAAAITETSAGLDVVLGRSSRFGLGFQLTQPERPLGPGARGFGHFGAGGSLGFADPDARLAFGYVMNLPGPRWQDPRSRALIDAVYGAL